MISTADWDESLWTNKQQIASRLVPDFRVVYVEPLKSVGAGKRKSSVKHWKDDCGVHVVRPFVALPFGNKLDRINRVNQKFISWSIRRIIGDLGFEEYILWIYTPNGHHFIKNLSPAITCYDCVDEYSAFPGAWRGAMLKMEAKLIANADVVFTTAQSLYESKSRHNSNCHLVPNVGDYDHFSKAQFMEPTESVRNISGPVIGFVGALNYKLDDNLLSQLFNARPEWSFVFVGPDKGFGFVDRYAHLPNVHFMGLRPIAKLPAICAGFDAAIIPYKVDSYTKGVMPIKFFGMPALAILCSFRGLHG